MQASQSNTASDLLKPEATQDLKTDGAFHRVFPSPFSTPIQAARKYLERQRSESGETGSRESGNKEHGASKGALNQASREQDRRLERSLYEGHSIEAGLHFGPVHSSGEDGVADKAYLVDGDGSELLYRYAAPGSAVDPDPEVVRGAIFRLARQSQLQRKTLPATGTDASIDGRAKTVVGPILTPDFGEVARQVWAADSVIPCAASNVIPEYSPGYEAEVKRRTSQTHEEAVKSSQERHSEDLVQQEETTAGNHAKALVKDTEVAEEGTALAHDACNLLSGLSLYSELLGSPGVLNEPHRHYAEELRLMAARSQVLIDRLRQVATKHEIEESSVPPVSAIAGDPHRPVGSAMEEVVRSGDEGTNLADLLMRWGSLLSVLAQGTLEVVIGAEVTVPIPVAVEALERILVNLVCNARAATVDGGAIRIRVAAAGASAVERSEFNCARGTGIAETAETIVLTVDDSGCGMPEAKILRILGQKSEVPDPQTASSLAGGRRGLGLRIVRELVAASGGTLAVQSELGRGTRVEIRWPVVTIPAALPQSLSSIAEMPEPLDIVEVAKAPIAPDGLSEAQLRAMMLRLQRPIPQERSPLSRKRSNRRVFGAKSADPRFGVLSLRMSPSNGPEVERINSGRNDSAEKGAIAC